MDRRQDAKTVAPRTPRRPIPVMSLDSSGDDDELLAAIGRVVRSRRYVLGPEALIRTAAA